MILNQGDLATLKKKCSREVVERCQAERRALESQGIFLDNEVQFVYHLCHIAFLSCIVVSSMCYTGESAYGKTDLNLK